MASNNTTRIFTASEAAQALNHIMRVDDRDQESMLEVLSDFFYSPDEERIVNKRREDWLEISGDGLDPDQSLMDEESGIIILLIPCITIIQ